MSYFENQILSYTSQTMKQEGFLSVKDSDKKQDYKIKYKLHILRPTQFGRVMSLCQNQSLFISD